MHVVSPDPIPTTLRTWKPGARKPRIPDQASPKPRRGDESGPGRSERVAAWNAAAQVLAVRAAEERKLSMPKAARAAAKRAAASGAGDAAPASVRPPPPPRADDGEPLTWERAVGECLSPSVNRLGRNAPLDEQSDGEEWLALHLASRKEIMKQQHEAQAAKSPTPLTPRGRMPTPRGGRGGAASAAAPLLRLETGAQPSRRPPRLAAGERPQVVLLQMDGLVAESFHRSWWAKDEAVHARPGVVDGLVRLRQRFLLCALCRSAPPAAEKTLLELRRRGLRFDLAYALPDEMRHDREAAPCLGAAAERQLCRDFDALQRPAAPISYAR